MSLYNLLFGYNQLAGVLLTVLELDPGSVPRFRDCWWNRDLQRIVVHTRTGGGNREAYEAENYALARHPHYERDEDDDFDNTFADFYFTLPEKWAHIKEELDELAGAPVKTGDRWQAAVAAIEGKQPNPEVKVDAERVRRAATSLAEKLDTAFKNAKPGDPPNIIEV